MFQTRTLNDVITAYRRPNVEKKFYLNSLLSETKNELTANDFPTKRLGAQKLLFVRYARVPN